MGLGVSDRECWGRIGRSWKKDRVKGEGFIG